MVNNAFFVSTILCMVIMLFCLQELQFLIPYRRLLLDKYAGVIGLFMLALFMNLFGLVYLIGRKIFLKDTGQKLAHLEKQLRSGPSISEELSDRLKEE